MLISLPRSFENFKDELLYDKEDSIVLKEVQTVVRFKKFSMVKDLNTDDNGEGLSVSIRGNEHR